MTVLRSAEDHAARDINWSAAVSSSAAGDIWDISSTGPVSELAAPVGAPAAAKAETSPMQGPRRPRPAIDQDEYIKKSTKVDRPAQ